MEVIDLGQCEYKSAMKLQRHYVTKRQQEEIKDQLLMVEHPPVITMGATAEKKNILVSNEKLEREGISVIEADRGGDVTYHGPGQQIAYPIIDLLSYDNDVLKYIRLLEEVLISVLFRFGLEAHRMNNYTGVWIGKSKIAAIGIAVSKMVTMHGLALNVNPNMKHFSYIIPCGISEYPITSMTELLKKPVNQEAVKCQMIKSLIEAFDHNSKSSKQGKQWNGVPAYPSLA